MKKYNKLPIVSLILSIVGFLVSGVKPNVIVVTITLLIFIASFVFAIIGQKQINKNKQKGKALSIISIVLAVLLLLGELSVIYTMYALSNVETADATVCSEVTDCVDNGDGTSTCLYGSIEATCTTEKLNDDQFK